MEVTHASCAIANYAYLLKLANAFKINYVDTVKTTTNVLSLIKITSKELISAEQDTFCKWVA